MTCSVQESLSAIIRSFHSVLLSHVVQVYAGEVGQPVGEPSKTMKSKVWQSVVEQLKAEEGVPNYAGKQLCTKAGGCSVNGGIANGSSIS